MKILIVSPIMPPEIGGPASYIPEVINRLGEKFHFRVITFTPNPNRLGGTIVRPVSQQGGMLFRQVRLFWETVKNALWADVIFVQEPLVAGVSAGLVGVVFRKPVVVRFVGYQPWEELLAKGQTKKFLDGFLADPDGEIRSRLYILFTRLAFKMARKVIVPSRYLRDILIKHFSVPPSKISHIYNAFALPRVATLPKNKIKTAISIGRIIFRKRVDWTVEAVARYIKKSGRSLRLLVVGDGPDKPRIEKLARNLVDKYEIKPFVRFFGQKSWLEGLSILKSADIYLLTSVYEGLPFTVLESLSLGVPVVATEIRGTNEVAIDQKTALTSLPGDVPDLTKNIATILDNPQLARELVESGRKMIMEKFTWEENIKKTSKVFSELVTDS